MLAVRLPNEYDVPFTFMPVLQVLDVDVLYQRLYDEAPVTFPQLTVAAVAEVAVAVRLPGVPQVVPPLPLDCVVNVALANPESTPAQEAATRTLYVVAALSPLRV